jgi:hypothetical protein
MKDEIDCLHLWCLVVQGRAWRWRRVGEKKSVLIKGLKDRESWGESEREKKKKEKKKMSETLAGSV